MVNRRPPINRLEALADHFHTLGILCYFHQPLIRSKGRRKGLPPKTKHCWDIVDDAAKVDELYATLYQNYLLDNLAVILCYYQILLELIDLLHIYTPPPSLIEGTREQGELTITWHSRDRLEKANLYCYWWYVDWGRIIRNPKLETLLVKATLQHLDTCTNERRRIEAEDFSFSF